MATLKQPANNSQRITWLREYYFKGLDRKWNNDFVPFTTGEPYDELFEEMNFYIVPETYSFFEAFRTSYRQNATPVRLCDDFWQKSLVERRAWFVKECMINYMPQEVLPGDLIAGGRFNLMASRCWNKKEAQARNGLLFGKGGLREQVFEFHDRGFGNLGPTAGHLIPDYKTAVEKGWNYIYDDIRQKYDDLPPAARKGEQGEQLRAMMEATQMPRDLAAKYAIECDRLAGLEQDETRRQELLLMAANLRKVPWVGATTFHEAVQALFLTHMLVLSDECYPGAGVSFGRIDQYLFPYWETSINDGMDREFGKEILKCFFLKCNYAYDAMIQTGNNQGITAGYGQLFNLSGMGAGGKDMSNDLTFAFLEVIDDLSPLLEPKPNVRLHRNSPDLLLDKVVDMVSGSQGAPFLLNFDERSMAGLLRQARLTGCENYINESNVHDYACVGCMENTMQGNDRSGTVDNNFNLLKSVELTLTGGYDLDQYYNSMGEPVYSQNRHEGPIKGEQKNCETFEDFFTLFQAELKYLVHKGAELYNELDSVRAQFSPTPYLSCLVRGCAESGKDVTSGGAQLKFTTIEGVTFATAVDSLLAIKYLVYDKKEATLEELINALKSNWEGNEILQAKAKFKAPKYGRDDDEADYYARRVMDFWATDAWNYKTEASGVQFRAGMLSWNYWVSDGVILAASADGRKRGQFLSNAICPSSGADTNGPTANANSVGKALGGKSLCGGDYQGYLNNLPNGASHTMTFSPAMLKDPGHKQKFKAFLNGYIENGGTALQINVLDAQMLKDAQQNPENYRDLLVRITGYNAYFTSVGKELQDEIIARESHNKW